MKPGAIREDSERALETAALLEKPGAAGLRIHVMLKTGNERASNALAVESKV